MLPVSYTRWWTALGCASHYNPGVVALADDSYLTFLRAEAEFPPLATSLLVQDYDRPSLFTTVTPVGFHTDARIEDARPFLFNDQILVSHTQVRPGSIRMGLSRYDRLTATLTRGSDWQLPIVYALIEKNWVLLTHDQQLHCVYALDPLLIFRRWSFDAPWIRVVSQTTNWTTALGKPPRNSTHLLPFNNGYLGWWHSQIDGVYVHGAYWLDHTLHLTARTGILFDGQDIIEGHKPGVLYVTSQTIDRSGIRLWCGEADQYAGVIDLSPDDVWGRMRPVQQP